MSASIKSILVVDLSHCFWSVFLGGGLKNASDAREIVLRDIKGLSSGYDRTAICLDGPMPSFRTRFWPGYKAKRKERPEEGWTLLADTARHLDALGFHVLSAPEHPDHPGTIWEADDVIASVVGWARERGIAADILSGDSDLAQLVDDGLRVCLLRRYKGAIKRYGESQVREWVGVPPAVVADYKALAGDGGDGYGDIFPGIGHEKALALLKATGGSAREAVRLSIESTKDTADGRMFKGAGIERVDIAYALSRVVCSVPIEADQLLIERAPYALPETGEDLLPPIAPEGEEIEAIPLLPGEAPGATGAPINPTHAIVLDPGARLLASPAEARARLLEFRAFIKSCLVPGVDYGRIPGCGQKPVLFKSGAEKFGEIYGFVPTIETEKAVETFDDPPLFFYRIKVTLSRKSDGLKVAECVGSANSREKKYADRWVREGDIPPWFDPAKLKSKERPARDGDKAYTVFRIPNEEIWDSLNAILKIAFKRAYVGAMLIATRASGIFDVDREDSPIGMRDVEESHYGKAGSTPQWVQQ